MESTTIHYAAGPSDVLSNAVVAKKQIAPGIVVQYIGQGKNINAVHWNLEDGVVVPMHHHTQEQFGYVIRGALETIIGGETYTVRAGDSYLIPSDVSHEFKAVGVTEAIDIFSPLRDLSTIGGQAHS